MYTLRWKNGDIDISSATGRGRYIRGLEKTTQDVAHALLTVYDVRRMRGSELLQFEEKVRGSDAIPVAQSGFIRRYVEDALRRLMAYQQRNRGRIPDDEFIHKIESVEVYSGSSPTDVYFYAYLRTLEGDVAPAAFQVNLRHQLPESARPFLPGLTDDYGPST